MKQHGHVHSQHTVAPNLKANADIHTASKARADWTRRQAEVGKQFWERRRELDTRPLLGDDTQRTNVRQVDPTAVQAWYWWTELFCAQIHHVVWTERVPNCNVKDTLKHCQLSGTVNTNKLQRAYAACCVITNIYCASKKSIPRKTETFFLADDWQPECRIQLDFAGWYQNWLMAGVYAAVHKHKLITESQRRINSITTLSDRCHQKHKMVISDSD